MVKEQDEFISFFFNDTATTEIYTLSLHDALRPRPLQVDVRLHRCRAAAPAVRPDRRQDREDRKSTRLNSSHVAISYAVFCLKKKKNTNAGADAKNEKTEPKKTAK